MRLVSGIIALLILFGGVQAREIEGEPKPPKKRPAPERIADEDSLLKEAGIYRRWIIAQNEMDDRAWELDQKIFFIKDRKLRAHPDRVYFYRNIDQAVKLARELKMPLAFYVFDHDCEECAFTLVELYTDPEIVAASRDFINVYVRIPQQKRDVSLLGLMDNSNSVQFFLPGLKRLRVLTAPRKDSTLEAYARILEYAGGLSEEELLWTPPEIAARTRGRF